MEVTGELGRLAFESKSSTVALAALLIFDEIERIKTELVSEEDLALAKSALIEQFPSMFQSKSDTLRVFVNDELTNRDREYWGTYRKTVSSVTAEDVQRVAKQIITSRRNGCACGWKLGCHQCW